MLNGGAFTIESEYSNYNRLGGYDAAYAKSQGAYGLASFLFPKVVPIGKFNGKFELLGKYAKAEFTHGPTPSYDQKTTEINFSYIIKQFNARVMTFYKDTRFNRDRTQFLGGRRRPPDPDVKQDHYSNFRNERVIQNQGVNFMKLKRYVYGRRAC